MQLKASLVPEDDMDCIGVCGDQLLETEATAVQGHSRQIQELSVSISHFHRPIYISPLVLHPHRCHRSFSLQRSAAPDAANQAISVFIFYPDSHPFVSFASQLMEFVSNACPKGFNLLCLLVFVLFAGNFATRSYFPQPIVDAGNTQADASFLGELSLNLVVCLLLLLPQSLLQGRKVLRLQLGPAGAIFSLK